MRVPNIILGILVAFFIILYTAMDLMGEWLWFLSVGYESVWLGILLTSLALGTLSFLAFFAFISINILAARKIALGKKKANRVYTRMLLVFAALVSLVAGFAMSRQWETLLKYLNYTAFPSADPVFNLNIGFYVFTLPLYSVLLNYVLALFIASAVFSVISYVIHSRGFRVVKKEGEWEEAQFIFAAAGAGSSLKWKGSWRKLVPHLNVLMFLIFAAISAHAWLARYGVLLSSSGAVFGAGYTDLAVTVPMLTVLSVAALLIGLFFLANLRINRLEFIKHGLTAFVVIAVLGILAGGVVQGLVVGPDEFNLEEPYLERNIAGTLAAYGLDSAQEEVFPVDYSLTARDIAENDATVGNIRLWDWRPLGQTYDQLQLFRTYYNFNDVDVDRYEVNGMYKQVLVSAREMNSYDLPGQAQTWVNRHLVYTHGHGVVMNPVDRVSGEGLPVFYIKDIPPKSPYFTLDRPEIYFGEQTDNYAVVGTSTDEFDYPSGDQNIYTSHSAEAGVKLSDAFTRLVYALKMRSIELLVSGSITPESRLLMYRNIKKRAPTIAPFLSYDWDPYIVVSEGKLYWILDAYTTTDMYPYSEPLYTNGYLRRMNYIRNSVKVVIDAYTGKVDYYVIDQEDPIIQAYMGIFPDLFQDIGLMPDGLRAHVRYPEGLLRIQSSVYSTYHMKDPRVFYNKEDTWVTPEELYRGSREPMMPYYIIMRLPGEEREEFMLMIPFTPKNKENLIGWMAARSDGENYGKILVYQFSKQELTYGPMQVEARIDQDTEISQLITLWSQAGSSVLRGNTLVIPIENSILYVEPLYLEATEKGTLPQLQRVIVSYGDRLTMQKTLSEALGAIFGTGEAEPEEEPAAPITRTVQEKLTRIGELYDSAQQALAAGNLGLYQSYVEQIGELAG